MMPAPRPTAWLATLPGQLWSMRFFIALLLLFCLTRLLFIFTSEYAPYVEECKEAALGLDLVNGQLRLPFWLYLDSPHAGGSVFAGLASTPFYWLIGNVYAATKVTALAFSLLALAVIYSLIRTEYRLSDRLTAVTLFPLFVLSTPHYLQKSVVLIGNTVELILVIVLVTQVYLVIQRSPGRQLLRHAWLGLLCGLGVWIQYGAASIVLTVLLFWFSRDKLFFLTPQFLVFGACAAVGISPLLIYQATYDFAPLRVDQFSGAPLLNLHPTELLSRLGHMLAVDLPRSFHFFGVGPLDGRAYAYALYVVIGLLFGWLLLRGGHHARALAGSLWSLRRRPRRPYSPPLHVVWMVYLLVVIALFSVSRMPIGNGEPRWNSMVVHHEYYILFMQPLAFTLAAIALARLISSPSRRARLAGKGGLLLITLIVVPCFANVMSFSKVSGVMLRPNDCTCGNVREAGMSYRTDPRLMLRVLSQLDPPYRKYLWQGAGFGWYLQCCTSKHSVNPQLLNRSLAALSERQQRQLFWALLNAPSEECAAPPQVVHGDLEQLLDPRFRPLFRQQRQRWARRPEPADWKECFNRPR